MLEKMAPFFEARLSDYEEHMLCAIEGAREFYPFTADCLPKTAEARVLDLGCGTGLELEAYLTIHPDADVTGIDLSSGMLSALRKKFPDRRLNLVCGSYFDLPLGCEVYDAAVSVESLHHFTKEEKIPLYRRLCTALKKEGYFILTDYFASCDADERAFRAEYMRLRREQGISDGAFYHYDTPLTVAHECEALGAGGFSRIEILKSWGATYVLRATK